MMKFVVFLLLLTASFAPAAMAMTVAEAREVLGLNPNYSPDDLKSHYRQLTRQLHPDHFFNEPEAVKALMEAKFLKVRDAYDLLTGKASATNSNASSSARPQPSGDFLQQVWTAVVTQPPQFRTQALREIISRPELREMFVALFTYDNLRKLHDERGMRIDELNRVIETIAKSQVTGSILLLGDAYFKMYDSPGFPSSEFAPIVDKLKADLLNHVLNPPAQMAIETIQIRIQRNKRFPLGDPHEAIKATALNSAMIPVNLCRHVVYQARKILNLRANP